MQNNPPEIVRRVFVKVFGFSRLELQALQVAFFASQSRCVAYSICDADTQKKAQVLLIDGDSWEAVLTLANPQYDTLKLIWVGSRPPDNAWRSFSRPLRCDAVVKALDRHYMRVATQPAPPTSNPNQNPSSAQSPSSKITNPTQLKPVQYEHLATTSVSVNTPAHAPMRRALVIDANKTDRLDWCAKLLAAGWPLLDEAQTAQDARRLVCSHTYELVVIDLQLTDASSWTLLKELGVCRPAIKHIIVTGQGLSRLDSVRAWFAGAQCAMNKPFHPSQISEALKKTLSEPL